MEGDMSRASLPRGCGGQRPRGKPALWLYAVAALMLAGCAAPQLAPPANTRISGVVYGDRAQDQEAGRTVLAPLVATVQCNGVQATATTDGRFSLSVKTADRYTCLAKAPSYQSGQAVLIGARGGILRLAFGGALHLTSCVTGAATATAEAVNTPLAVPTTATHDASGDPSVAAEGATVCPELQLIPGAVSGVVTRAEDGAVATKVRVTCWQPGGPTQTSGTGNTHQTLTDTSGQFAFGQMPISQYLCTAGDDPTAFIVSPAPGATSSVAFKMCTNSCPDVHYAQGDVMHTMTVYLLFWLPHGRMYSAMTPSSYETIIQRYFQSIGGSPFYNIVTQYWDTTNGYMLNSVKLGDSYVDTTAYPHAATRSDPLQDQDIAHEIGAAMTARHWTKDNAHVVFVYTAYGAEICSNASANSCSFQQAGHDTFCGYHSTTPNQTIYAVLPDTSACMGSTNDHPYAGANGDRLADTALISTSHEQFEAATDPFQGGWWGLNPHVGEIGDKCDGTYGTVTLKGNTFYVQAEWSNRTNSCVYAL